MPEASTRTWPTSSSSRSRTTSFDAVLAAWMLYHVPDLDRGLSELARVLVPAAGSSRRRTAPTISRSSSHSVGIERWELPFEAENGAEILGARTSRACERPRCDGTVTFRDIEARSLVLRARPSA